MPSARGWLLAALACLALAALSLLLPSTPTFDPWEWINWGREILHGQLSTAEAASWKPLPVLFTTPFALFGSAAPDLWLVVARGAGLLALFAGFVLARRAAPGAAGIAGGVFAALGLAVTRGNWLYIFLGNSEGLLVLLVLVAVLLHLDGRPRAALVAGTGAALLRPEVWPFLLAYGLWQVWRDRPVLGLGAGLAAIVVAAWLVPEKLGSGKWLRAADRAVQPEKGSPSLANARHPFLAVLDAAQHQPGRTVLAGVVLAAALGIRALMRGRARDAWPLALAVAALAWALLVAVMTGSGFAGNPRYLVLSTAVLVVAAGAAWGRAAAWVGARLGGGRAAAVAALAVVALGVLSGLPAVPDAAPTAHALAFQARLREDLPQAIRLAGGRDRVVACGPASTELYQVPMVAWHLRVEHRFVAKRLRATGWVFRTRPKPRRPALPRPDPRNQLVGRAGLWRVYSGPCAPSK